MAVGRDLKGKKNNVIAVIGDGAITGGMAYEAMNHAGFLDSNMIVILNDNQQVGCPLAPPLAHLLACYSPSRAAQRSWTRSGAGQGGSLEVWKQMCRQRRWRERVERDLNRE
eukprot:5444398-Pyramimonas_sp.AAC.1